MLLDRADLSAYASIPVWYGCNNRCVLCMLAGFREGLRACTPPLFHRIVRALRQQGRYRRLILTGAEATLCPDLESYLGAASAPGHFERIQVQTNGRRLSDRAFLRRLADAGLTEVLVSIHGFAETHERITRTAGSFGETLSGIHNAASLGLHVITNTVLTRVNAGPLPAFLAFLGAQPVHEMHLWNYFPMEEEDSRGLLVSAGEMRALLPRVGRALHGLAKPVTLKNFPFCLPVAPPLLHDNGFPRTWIERTYWERYRKNGFGTCAHRRACRAAACWGLSRAHAARYGREPGALSPMGEPPGGETVAGGLP